MKLDRNNNADGMGKYALIRLRKLAESRDGPHAEAIHGAIKTLIEHGLLDWGAPNTESEFSSSVSKTSTRTSHSGGMRLRRSATASWNTVRKLWSWPSERARPASGARNRIDKMMMKLTGYHVSAKRWRDLVSASPASPEMRARVLACGGQRRAGVVSLGRRTWVR